MISMSLFLERKFSKYYCHLHITKQFDIYKVYIKWGIVGSDAGKLKSLLIFPHPLLLHYLLVLQNSYLQKVLWKFANPCICLLPDNLPLTLAVKTVVCSCCKTAWNTKQVTFVEVSHLMAVNPHTQITAIHCSYEYKFSNCSFRQPSLH